MIRFGTAWWVLMEVMLFTMGLRFWDGLYGVAIGTVLAGGFGVPMFFTGRNAWKLVHAIARDDELACAEREAEAAKAKVDQLERDHKLDQKRYEQRQRDFELAKRESEQAKDIQRMYEDLTGGQRGTPQTDPPRKTRARKGVLEDRPTTASPSKPS